MISLSHSYNMEIHDLIRFLGACANCGYQILIFVGVGPRASMGIRLVPCKLNTETVQSRITLARSTHMYQSHH